MRTTYKQDQVTHTRYTNATDDYGHTSRVAASGYPRSVSGVFSLVRVTSKNIEAGRIPAYQAEFSTEDTGLLLGDRITKDGVTYEVSQRTPAYSVTGKLDHVWHALKAVTA